MKRTTVYLTLALLLGGGTAFAQSATQGHIPGTPDPVFGTDTIGGSTDHAKDQAPIPTYSDPAATRQDQQTSYLGWQSRTGGGTDAQSNNVPIPSYADQSAVAATAPSHQTVQIVPFGGRKS